MRARYGGLLSVLLRTLGGSGGAAFHAVRGAARAQWHPVTGLEMPGLAAHPRVAFGPFAPGRAGEGVLGEAIGQSRRVPGLEGEGRALRLAGVCRVGHREICGSRPLAVKTMEIAARVALIPRLQSGCLESACAKCVRSACQPSTLGIVGDATFFFCFLSYLPRSMRMHMRGDDSEQLSHELLRYGYREI
jgi:hypothetical protein